MCVVMRIWSLFFPVFFYLFDHLYYKNHLFCTTHYTTTVSACWQVLWCAFFHTSFLFVLMPLLEPPLIMHICCCCFVSSLTCVDAHSFSFILLLLFCFSHYYCFAQLYRIFLSLLFRVDTELFPLRLDKPCRSVFTQARAHARTQIHSHVQPFSF
jgi:hypothetical protein